ncbi:nicotinate phosphoribosyltransferase [Synechococcus sp. CCY9201]|uniref:nicotinate phosphoribosyltransferase n=1 Tax=Synechococcus sp. CCY9201 TaxID=174697 RepID=UPI002B2070C6|nr:nicotinate phosphoribosyltransferase [Synechococcus sp. CCY9201]MEA5474812.1 nicotinate phosphoribosyltransferase [Synechococcus sp. CCY9201]
METNLLFDTDSYKTSHWLQYPPDLTAMGAYLESRGGENPATLFFGLQMLLLQSFTTPITQADVEEAEEFWQSHGLPFNRPGWERVVQVHGGRLPLLIRAVPEGSRVPTGQVLMTVESTDPQLAWLVTWVETQLLRIWYPTTVATRSWELRTVLAAALERSADDPAVELAFRLHDFGSRGVSSLQSAAIGGLAHLIAFRGSDTGAALVAGRRYYDCPMAGFSIPAAEHSTVLAWGQKHEAQAYRNMLDHFARPGAVLAVVSDSYDLWNAVDHLWGEQLRPQVIEAGATVVIRPDSGDPVRIVSELLRRLEARFGSRMNGKGYRVLQHVRVIQGDGITAQTLPLVLEAVLAAGFSAENVAYGMGGGLLQQLNRDTQRFVYKASWVERSGQILPVHKRPITDPAKTSKAGVLDLIHTGGTYRTIVRPLPGIHPDSCLQTVYENGELLNRCSLDQVRERAVLG